VETGRVVHVASVGVKFDVMGGAELAVEAVRRRTGSIFDPAIVETFTSRGSDFGRSGGSRRCGLGRPCWKRIACTRFFSERRCLTRCSRKRACSRSARAH
jgi:hypothetical protein